MMFRHLSIKFVVLVIFIFSVKALHAQVTAPAAYGPVPSKNQVKWHQMEMYCMVSFDLNTFTDQEWGYGDVNPALFNPTDFNASQIVNAAKSAGVKGLILVCKHHDGFCLWPTKTTDYNISKSPWKNGKGDMVKAFELACHKAGIAFGIYCSPWDRHSAYYGKPEYLKIYRQQLRELYTRYGPAFIAWFDGANGGDGYYGGAREKRIIDRTSYYGWDSTWAMVRKLQPRAVIFSDIGPDVRWVGNENGEAAETSWATFTPEPLAGKTKVGVGEINYSNSPAGTRKGKYWMPAECDVPLRPGWFYHASQDDQVKTPEQLFALYLKSVGRGADLDLGLAPDKQGLLKSNDVKSLAGFGKLLKETFAANLAKGAKLQASNIRGSDDRQYGPKNVLDQNIYSYWATDDSIKTPQLTLNLKGDKRFNIISIREDIKLGQRVASFAVDAWIDNSWRQVAQATSVGNLRLIRLPHYIITSKVRLRITESPVCPAISDFGLYATPKTPDLQEQAKTGS